MYCSTMRAMRAHFWILLLAVASRVVAAEQTVGPLTLPDAVDYALAHHPRVAVDVAAAEVRKAEVSVGRAAYLPNLDFTAQLEGGSGNVLRGALFPMRGIPNVSGPPAGRGLGDSALGSVLGMSVSWDAVGLVTRMAQVDAALAVEDQAHATIE